ncbi:MAG: hypothetical protein ABI041_13575 [Bdellovibrionia bacterium]
MKQFLFLWLEITTSAMLLVTFQSWAAMPEKDYRAALQVAERKVLRTNQIRNNSENLSASTLKMLFGRFYKVGDSWDIASWNFTSSKMRKTSDPEQIKKQLGPGAIFHYEVMRIRSGAEPEVDFKVTQMPSRDFKVVDSRVSQLNLTMRLTSQDQLTQIHKTYSFLEKNISNNNQTPLELFPLDIPETLNAEQQTKPTEPELPSEIQDIANRLGFHPSLSQSTEFHQDDFFGRSVQILWQHGDPWPVYLRTVNGIAILIRKGRL